MKTLLKSAAAAVLLASSLTSNAGLITDVENVNSYVGWWQSKQWTHDITEHDFVLGSATSATLSIEFSDDSSKWLDLGELATIVVGTIDFADGSLIYNPINDFSQSIGLQSLGFLNDSGSLTVKVWSDFGDFIIGKSTLEVATRDQQEEPSPVPEPSSLALIGAGLAALTLARRKQK